MNFFLCALTFFLGPLLGVGFLGALTSCLGCPCPCHRERPQASLPLAQSSSTYVGALAGIVGVVLLFALPGDSAHWGFGLLGAMLAIPIGARRIRNPHSSLPGTAAFWTFMALFIAYPWIFSLAGSPEPGTTVLNVVLGTLSTFILVGGPTALLMSMVKAIDTAVARHTVPRTSANFAASVVAAEGDTLDDEAEHQEPNSAANEEVEVVTEPAFNGELAALLEQEASPDEIPADRELVSTTS